MSDDDATHAFSPESVAQIGPAGPGGSLVGHRIGQLELVEEIGEGGVGRVYRAVHPRLGRSYAIKVLRPDLARDPSAVERLRREAISLSALRHPSVVFIHDFGHDPVAGIWLALEYLDGISLGDALIDGALPLYKALRWGRQLASALAAVHRQGIVHRDVKPENVMLVEDGGPIRALRLLDFGIVKLADEPGAQLTQVGRVVGTPAYMAPEQILGEREQIGPATDLYALGCVLWELVTGRRLFLGNSHFGVMRAQVEEEPPKLEALRPDLADSSLPQLLGWLLAKEPERRPRSAEQVEQALADVLAEARALGLTDAWGPSETPPPETVPRAPLHALRRTLARDDSWAGRAAARLPWVRMDGVALLQALWGLVHSQLTMELGDEAAFARRLEQLVTLLTLALESGDPDLVTPLTVGLRATRALLPKAPRLLLDEQLSALEARRAETPREELMSGSWSIAAVTGEQKQGSLMDALSEDVSVASIKALLGHKLW